MFLVALMAFCCLPCGAQIRNRMGVKEEVFLKYADGRLQQYNPDNLALADSIYGYGRFHNDARYRALALSLELPVRCSQGDFERAEQIRAEFKQLLASDGRIRDFYFLTMYDYCNLMILSGHVSQSMLEARDMSRRASESGNNLGQMYAHRIIGLIQSYRTNSVLAIGSFLKSADYCVKAKEEQEIPNIYILIAQEYIKLGRYEEAEDYCARAAEFQDFYPSLRVKTAMTHALIYQAQGNDEMFRESYQKLVSDPLYKVQTDRESRSMIDIAWLRSRGMLKLAAEKADSLPSDRNRFEQLSSINADRGEWKTAFKNLSALMETKDSIYIAVQNEDMAILDAELENARLRLEAERLQNQNEMTILIGFILLFALLAGVIIFTQWQLRTNLDNLRMRNKASLESRDLYRKALDAKELENDIRVWLIRKNKTKESSYGK